MALSDVASCYGNVSVISLRTGLVPQDPRLAVSPIASPRLTGSAPTKAASVPNLQRSPTKKRPPVVTIAKPQYVEELKGDEDAEYVVQLQKKEIEVMPSDVLANLQSLLLKLQKLESSNQTLLEEVKELRGKLREAGVTTRDMEILKLQRENQLLMHKLGMKKHTVSDKGTKIVSMHLHAELEGHSKEMERLIEKFLDPNLQIRKEFLEGYVDIHFKDQDIIRRTFAQILRRKLFEVRFFKFIL